MPDKYMLLTSLCNILTSPLVKDFIWIVPGYSPQISFLLSPSAFNSTLPYPSSNHLQAAFKSFLPLCGANFVGSSSHSLPDLPLSLFTLPFPFLVTSPSDFFNSSLFVQSQFFSSNHFFIISHRSLSNPRRSLNHLAISHQIIQRRLQTIPTLLPITLSQAPTASS